MREHSKEGTYPDRCFASTKVAIEEKLKKKKDRSTFRGW
jgi:hypothetical protein